MNACTPKHLDVKKDRGLTIEWADGGVSYYSIALLRKHSPSADMRQLRREMDANPLAILPSGGAAGGAGGAGGSGELVIVNAELVGNYAINFSFSDGHATGIYTWEYLRELDAKRERS
jgi:DUF971 family protein